MSFPRLFLIVLLSVAVLSACGQTPTGPSAQPAGVSIGTAPQTGIPVPDRFGFSPPRALGLTRFVAFGDSITWGAYSSFDPRFLFAADEGGYVERLQAGLNFHHAPQRFTVFNEGVPGELAVNALPRFRSMLTTRRPEAVLLLEGINDLNNDLSPSRVASGLAQLIATATSVGVPVLVATQYPTYEVQSPEGMTRPNAASAVAPYNAEIRRLVAGRLNVHLVDLESTMRDRRFVGNDGIHLTDDGFARMASTFMTAIEAAFPVRGSFQ